MDPVAEIKSRISIEELVGQYVQLKKVGRNFKALCPFHSEKSPSFYISPERQLAYCFGCHKGGDHFKFIQEVEGIDFRSALVMLAERAGVSLPKAMPYEKKNKGERDRLFEIHEKATQLFEKNLWETSEGEKVLGYLRKRGLTDETIKKYRLGFAPEKTELYNYLLQKDFTQDEIQKSGLVIARDTADRKYVDRFRMRLMFPLFDVSGMICGFGGRAVREGDEPKYLNSPETPIFHKSSFLYGLAQGRLDIRKQNKVVVVEGYMDCLASHQAGITYVVACSGTALTQDHLRLIKRYTKDLTLALDQDNAGKLATERSLELALSEDLVVKVVSWEGDAKDPDEALRKDPSIFTKALDNAKSALDYLLTYYKEKFHGDTLEGKKHTTDALLPFLKKLQSPVELDEWLKKIGDSLSLSLNSLYDEVKRFQGKQVQLRGPQKSPASTQQEGPDASLRLLTKQQYLLGLLLTYPESLGIANQLITPEDFEDNHLQNIYRSLTTQYNQTLDDQEKNQADFLKIFIESHFVDVTWDVIEKEVVEIIRSMAKYKFEQEKRSLVSKLKNLEGSEKEQLLTDYQHLLSKEEQFLTNLWPRNSKNS